MGDINFNFLENNSIGLPKIPLIDNFLDTPTIGLPKEDPVNRILQEISDIIGKFDGGYDKIFASLEEKFGGCGCPGDTAPIHPPNFWDGCQPKGAMQKISDTTITTPGGYKIEMVGQFDWKITGPDGKSTLIWGDPHVKESDGGNWDFKRDSTFVLGDGTKINVTTTPWSGNPNMTVTQKLEIISGNERIIVNDIDKGKGKIGDVTFDGYANINNFAGKDVFVMGKESDDWSYQGREVLSSNNGGESFNVGGELPVPTRGLPKIDNWANEFLSLLHSILRFDNSSFNNRWSDLLRQNPFGTNPYLGRPVTSWENTNRIYNRNEHLRYLQQAFNQVGRMFEVISKLAQLSKTVEDIRFRQRIY
jgi:hypothetical protein